MLLKDPVAVVVAVVKVVVLVVVDVAATVVVVVVVVDVSGRGSCGAGLNGTDKAKSCSLTLLSCEGTAN